jgi:hypothetical protein
VREREKSNMRKARAKRSMMEKTMSEACLATGSHTTKPAGSPRKKWYRSLSFVVAKKSATGISLETPPDKTECCESSVSASSEQSNHSPKESVPSNLTTPTKTRDCPSRRSSSSRGERLLQTNSEDPSEHNAEAMHPEASLTPRNKKVSLSSIQPRRSISHRDICVSPKARIQPQRTRSSSLQHHENRNRDHIHTTAPPRLLSLGFSERDLAARKSTTTNHYRYSPTKARQDQKSLLSSNLSLKISPTKQRVAALTPNNKSTRHLLSNGKMTNPLQKIPLSPSLWDAADYVEPSPGEVPNMNAMDPDIMCSTRKSKKSSISSIQLRRSMSHREIYVSPTALSRILPQRKRSSSLDFSDKDSVDVGKLVYNPTTLFAPTKSSSEGGPQSTTTNSRSCPNPSPSVRILVEATDFSDSGTVKLSVYDSSICVSQFSPQNSSSTKPSAAATAATVTTTPKRSIRSLLSNGKKMSTLHEIPPSPSLGWDAADSCHHPRPGVGKSSTKGGASATTPMTVGFSVLPCPLSPSSSAELMALAVIDGIRRAIKVQKMHEKNLNERILHHISFAHGRLSIGNTVGAVLSMKKAKRVEWERDRVRAAIACLEKHLAELNGSGFQCVRARTIAALPFCSIDCEDHEGGITKSIPRSNGAVINIAAHKQYALEVEQILSVSDHDKITYPDDETLLQELRSCWLEERADKCLEELRKLSPLRSKNCN